MIAEIPIQTLIIFQYVKQSTRFLRISTFQHKTTKSGHLMPNWVKNLAKDDFKVFSS